MDDDTRKKRGRPRKEDKLTPAQKMKRYRTKKKEKESKRRLEFWLPTRDEKTKGYPQMEKEALFSALSLEARRLDMYDLRDIDAYRKYFFASTLTAAKVVMKVILEEVKEAEAFDRAEAARAEKSSLTPPQRKEKG